MQMFPACAWVAVGRAGTVFIRTLLVWFVTEAVRKDAAAREELKRVFRVIDVGL